MRRQPEAGSTPALPFPKNIYKNTLMRIERKWKMSKIKLKPCPFCKSENISEGSRIFDFGEDIHIMCRECGAKIQICKEYGWDELRKRWNRRTGEQNETN